MNKKILLISCLAIVGTLQGQNLKDGLRYSKEDLNGTARFKALSGAFGSVGGDFSAMGINPAGGAIFSSSEIGISFGDIVNKNDITFYTGKNNTKSSDFYLGQFGLNIVFDNYKEAKWKKFNFAFNYEQGKNFFIDDMSFGGSFTKGETLQDYFAYYANGIRQANFMLDYDENGKYSRGFYNLGDTYNDMGRAQNAFNLRNGLLGYNVGLIDPISGLEGRVEETDQQKLDAIFNNTQYVTNSTAQALEKGVRQDFEIVREGGISKYNFNLSTQYGNDLYIGLNLKPSNVNYTESIKHWEQYQSADGDVKDAYFKNEFHTTGSGFAFDLGAIVKVAKNARVGLTYSSPTWYVLQDETSQYLSTNNNYFVADPNTIVVYEQYHFRTPSAWTASGSYFFGNRGFISLDYIYKGYKNLYFRDDYMKKENEIIENVLSDTNTIRVGGEFRATRNFSLRAGYRWEQSPYKDTKFIGDLNGYSFGLGYAFSGIRLDVSYDRSTQKNLVQMYESVITNPAYVKSKRGNLLFSLTAKLF